MRQIYLSINKKSNTAYGVHLLGHGDFSHLSVCRPSPWQSLPSIWGVGELQRRMRVITPAPQVTEQEDQGDQWLQLPSCLTIENERCKGLLFPSTVRKNHKHLLSLDTTHSACHTLGGSSLSFAQTCPRSCYWCGRKSDRAAECPFHRTQNNGSIQTRGTSHPQRSRSLSREQNKTIAELFLLSKAAKWRKAFNTGP